MEGLLYPPDLVKKFGRQAGLSEEQLEQVRKDVLATQGQLIDVEAKLKKLHLEIEAAIADDATPIDAILAKVEAIGATETEMKKKHMALLVRTRRALTPDQRRKLDELRPRFEAERPPPGPGPGHPPGHDRPR
jgi:Spy/CpxP family protein refolding chaperone